MTIGHSAAWSWTARCWCSAAAGRRHAGTLPGDEHEDRTSSCSSTTTRLISSYVPPPTAAARPPRRTAPGTTSTWSGRTRARILVSGNYQSGVGVLVPRPSRRRGNSVRRSGAASEPRRRGGDRGAAATGRALVRRLISINAYTACHDGTWSDNARAARRSSGTFLDPATGDLDSPLRLRGRR